MYRIVLYSLLGVLLGGLTGCAIAPLNVSNVGQTQLADGVVVRQVQLDKRLDSSWEKTQQLVCYAELQQSQLHGVSCQNDLGFVVFSGGQQQGEFIFERNNPLFSEGKARFITDLLQLDLFENYQFNPRYRIKKTDKQTLLSDSDGKAVAEVKQ